MNQVEIKSLSLRTAKRAKDLGITQKVISEAIRADQSQVSRVLSGKSKRQSRVFIEVCNYVNSNALTIGTDLVRENDELISALASVWDGTTRHATALATVIRSLGALTSHSSTGSHS
jgi:transcriptional regulator with XRE-family HTH domain